MRDVCVWAYKAKHRCVHLLILLILFLVLLRGRICPLLRQTNGGCGGVLFLQCVGVWCFYYLEFSKYVAWSNVTEKQIVVGSGRQSRGVRKLWHMSQGWPQNWHTATTIRHVLTKWIFIQNNRIQQSLLGVEITLRCGRLNRGVSPGGGKRYSFFYRGSKQAVGPLFLPFGTYLGCFFSGKMADAWCWPLRFIWCLN